MFELWWFWDLEGLYRVQGLGLCGFGDVRACAYRVIRLGFRIWGTLPLICLL